MAPDKGSKSHFFRCICAFLYRIWLQKLRSPFRTLLEFALPALVALIFYCMNRLAHLAFVPYPVRSESYLSDSRFQYCPFADYGPFSDVLGGTRLGAFASFASPAQIKCQRLLGFSIPAVIGALAAPGNPVLELASLFSGGNLDSLESLMGLGEYGVEFSDELSLRPFQQARRGSLIHVLRTIYAADYLLGLELPLITSDAPGQVPLAPACESFESYLMELRRRISPKKDATEPRTNPSESARRLGEFFVCKEEADGRIALRISSDETAEKSFPYAQRNLLYDSEAARIYAGTDASTQSASAVGLQLVLGGFARHRRSWKKSTTASLDRATRALIELRVRTEMLEDSPDRLFTRSKGTLYSLCTLCHPDRLQENISPGFRKDCDRISPFLSRFGKNTKKIWDDAMAAPFNSSKTPLPASELSFLRQQSFHWQSDKLMRVPDASPCFSLWNHYATDDNRSADDVLSELMETGGSLLSPLLSGGNTGDPNPLAGLLKPGALNLDFENVGPSNGSTSEEGFGGLMKEKLLKAAREDQLLDVGNIFGKFNQVNALPLLMEALPKLQETSPRLVKAINIVVSDTVLKNVEFKLMNSLVDPILRDFSIPEIGEASMPSNSVVADRWMMILYKSETLPFLFSQLMIIPLVVAVEILVSDKESKMRELLQILGASDPVRFCALFFFNSIWCLLISSLFANIISRVAFPAIPSILLGAIPWLFSFSVSAYSMLFAGIFNSRRRASAIASGVYGLGAFAYVLVQVAEASNFHFPQSVLMIFALPATMMHAFKILLLIGLQRPADAPPVIPFLESLKASLRGVSLLDCFLYMGINTVLYTILGLYFHQLSPGEFGIAKPWYFPLTSLLQSLQAPFKSSATFPRMSPDGTEADDERALINVGDRDVRRKKDTSETSPVLLRARGITKKYTRDDGTEFKAVDNLDFDLHEGEIYVLLGHNGAGKSTFINILTGITSATSGTVTIGGYPVGSAKARQRIGYCPQFDTVYPFLTVQEHLQIFGIIRGLDFGTARREASSLAEEMGLLEKKHAFVSTLSGGQRRRLSVAIAIAGRASVLFLDEPSTGLDLYSRRIFWTSLQKLRQGRALLLSTHLMDEAEILGDKIGIMAEAKLVCSGSALDLKKLFNVGYLLTISRIPNFSPQQDRNLTNLVTSIVKDASINSDVALEISFQLPLDSTAYIADLLTELENDNAKLQSSFGVNSFSLSVATLSEVFMRSGAAKVDELSGAETASAWDVAARRLSFDRTLERRRREVRELGTEGSALEDTLLKTSVKELAAASQEELPSLLLSVHDSNHSLSPGAKCGPLLSQIRALLFKRCLYHWRKPFDFLYRVIQTPLYFVLFLLVMKAVTILNQSNAVEPFGVLRSYPYARLTPQTVLYAFEEGVNPAFIAKEGQILQMADPALFKAVQLEDVRTPAEMDQYLLKLRSGRSVEEEDANFKRDYIGLFFEKDSNRVIYLHDSAFSHSLPTAMAFHTHCHDKYAAKKSNGEAAEFREEIAKRASLRERMLRDAKQVTQIFIAAVFVMTIASLLQFSADFIIIESSQQSLEVQKVFGVNLVVYWLVNYVVDLVIYLLSGTILYGIALFSFPDNILFVTQDSSRFGETLMITVFFGVAGVPFAYLVAVLFNFSSVLTPATLRNVSFLSAFLYIIFMFVGAISPKAAPMFEVVSLVVPHMALSQYFLTLNKPIASFLSMLHVRSSLSPWASLLYSALICFSILIFKELVCSAFPPLAMLAGNIKLALWDTLGFLFGICMGDRRKLPNPSSGTSLLQDNGDGSDDGVREEKRRLLKGAENDTLQVRGLTKRFELPGNLFKRKPISITAVNDIYFGVPPKQLFGLLGVNGSGKTTTIKMLTSLCSPTKGEASLNKTSLFSFTSYFTRPHVGYAPQQDALYETLTCSEHFNFYAMLAGYSAHIRRALVASLLEALGLAEYADRQACHLSGGTRKKLTVGLTLLRDPTAIFLDEPSSGVDPAARKRLWGLIAATARQRDRILIVTTHLIEECEALCERLTFMRHGKFACIGTPASLKAKLGRFYQLEMSLKLDEVIASEGDPLNPDQSEEERDANAVNQVVARVQGVLLGAQLMERLGSTLRFAIPKKSHHKISHVFRTIENIKTSLPIHSYCVSEASLDSVFLRLQDDEENNNYRET